EKISESLAVKLGKIIAVGETKKIKKFIGAHTKTIDLGGRTLILGLIDSHCHITSTAIRMEGVLDLSEEAGIKSINDIKAKIAERVKKIDAGVWIQGAREDEYKLQEKRHPTKWELDDAAPNNPVLISTVGGHFSIANSQAFESAGVTKDTPDPVGGKYERDPESGELTGGIHEKAASIIRRAKPAEKPLDREKIADMVKQIMMKNASVGLTCIYDNAGAREIRAALDLLAKKELPIRLRVDMPITNFAQLVRIGMNYRPFGNEWVKICGVKFFFDGAISARTAAVSEPSLHRPNFYGVMATTVDLAKKEIFNAYKEGCRISAHANGDRAISMYLDIMQEVQSQYPRANPRNRIIHCTVVNPELVDRISTLGLLPTLFGAYPYYHGYKLLPAFGEDRLEWTFASRSFLNAGVKVSAHSDYSASPFPPLMGIHALVNRTTKAGEPIGRSQKISVMEALRLYTINAAYQSFDEDRLGSIEEGKCADMVVLREDLLTVPEESILDIPIEITIVNGQIVYEQKARNSNAT
ncbi:amidohydrolase, partial [Acidobacteriota bacterium]